MDGIKDYTKGSWGISKTSYGTYDLHCNNMWLGCVHDDHHTPGGLPFGGFPGNNEAKGNACIVALAPQMYEFLLTRVEQGDISAKKILDKIEDIKEAL